MELRKDLPHELSAPHFPLLPTVEEVNAVLDIVTNDDVSIDRIAHAIEPRVLIAAAMIRTANSVSLGATRQIRSLRHALSLMGLQRVRRILLEMKLEASGERQRNSGVTT